MTRSSRVMGCSVVLLTSLGFGACCLISPDRAPTLEECLNGPDPRSRTANIDGDTHGQGSDLLGLGFTNLANPAYHVRVDQFDANSITTAREEPIVYVGIDSLALTGSVRRGDEYRALSGADWNGATMHGKLQCRRPGGKILTAWTTLRIRSVTQRPTIAVNGGPHAANGRSWVYDVELWREDRKQWVNACRDPNDVAFPIPGYWNEKGNYDRDKNVFSFACLQRDVAKCLRHGYPNDANAHDDQVKLFEACTRMMRADYCGDGNSYTRDGTLVAIWDNRDIPLPDHIEPLSFEAAWRPDGLACYKRLRWPLPGLSGAGNRSNPPVCLDANRPDKRKPECQTPEEARRMFPNKILLFAQSCETHPCNVIPAGQAPVSEQKTHRTLILPRKPALESTEVPGRAP